MGWEIDPSDSSILRWRQQGEWTLHTLKISAANRELKRIKFRPDIQSAADRAGITIKVRREIRSLIEFLDEGERVLYMASATFNDERGLIVMTDSRLIFSFKGWTRRHIKGFHHMRILSSEWRSGVLLGNLYVKFASGGKAKFRGIWKNVGQSIQGEISRQIEGVTDTHRDRFEMGRLATSREEERQVRSSDIAANEIIALDKRFKAGTIGREEYIEQKLELLKQTA